MSYSLKVTIIDRANGTVETKVDLPPEYEDKALKKDDTIAGKVEVSGMSAEILRLMSQDSGSMRDTIGILVLKAYKLGAEIKDK